MICDRNIPFVTSFLELFNDKPVAGGALPCLLDCTAILYSISCARIAGDGAAGPHHHCLHVHPLQAAHLAAERGDCRGTGRWAGSVLAPPGKAFAQCWLMRSRIMYHVYGDL